jgi:hypothetical protein
MQYMRTADAADAESTSDGDTNKLFFNHIGLSYRLYMAGNDDAVEDLDKDLVETYGVCQGEGV